MQNLDKKAARLNDQIVEHRRSANRLRRQAALMCAAAKGFNTADQRTKAMLICNELHNEANDENRKADKLLIEYLNETEKAITD